MKVVEDEPPSHYCQGRVPGPGEPVYCPCPHCIHPPGTECGPGGLWGCTCAACSPYGWGGRCDLDHCQLCGRSGRLAMQKHHVDYREGLVIRICARCHVRIHKGRFRPDLKPVVDKAAFEAELRARERSGINEPPTARTVRKSKGLRILRDLRPYPWEETAVCPGCGFAGPTLYRTTCARCRRTYPRFAPSSSPPTSGTGGAPGMEIGT